MFSLCSWRVLSHLLMEDGFFVIGVDKRQARGAQRLQRLAPGHKAHLMACLREDAAKISTDGRP